MIIILNLLDVINVQIVVILISETCKLFFKCSNSTLNLNNSIHFNASTNSLINNLNLFNDSLFIVKIDRIFYCDNLCDCPQCEDEFNCRLMKCDKANEIMCQDFSNCIEPRQICDNLFQCKDHSDEIGCFESRGCLSSGRFSCDNLCLDRALVCDGLVDDCSNKSDEDCECNEDEFRCFSGQCIKKSLRCNGIEFDCLDGTDEIQCVLIDERDIVLKVLPDLNHAVLCAVSNFTIQDADEICRLVGKESADEFSQIEIELENGTQWVNKHDFWKLSYQFKESKFNDLNKINETSCKDNLAQTVTCKNFNCSAIQFNNLTNSHIGTPREIESMFDCYNSSNQPKRASSVKTNR